MQLSNVALSKIEDIKRLGYEDAGVILMRGTQRTTVDAFGRVQHWAIDGSGKMVISEGVEVGSDWLEQSVPVFANKG